MTLIINALISRNLIKLMRDKMKLFGNLFLSVIFLFVFSFVMKSNAIGVEQPMNYLISGIIIMTVFQSSLTNSMDILEDISSGFMKEILVAPISRLQIAVGQVLSTAIISVVQGLIIVVIGLFMGLRIDLLHGLEMIGLMLLVGLTFSALGLFLATISKESGKFQLLVMIITFPLTFLSGAYIPTMALPQILMPIVYLNPLTYTTAAFRAISLHLDGLNNSALIKMGVAFNLHGFIITPWLSTLIIAFMLLGFTYLCMYRFKSADFSRVKVFKH